MTTARSRRAGQAAFKPALFAACLLACVPPAVFGESPEQPAVPELAFQRAIDALADLPKRLERLGAAGAADASTRANALATSLISLDFACPSCVATARAELHDLAHTVCPFVEQACEAEPRTDEKAEACRGTRAFCGIWIEPRSTGFALQVDQDVFDPTSADKDFTQGTEFSWYGRRVRGWLPWHLFDFVDAPARALFHDRWANAPTGHRISSLHFGYSAFTPRKGTVEQCLDPRWAGNATRQGKGCILSETDPIDDDRPYAGLLYVRARRSSVGYRTAWTTDLTIGVLGTGVGKAVQQFIHRNVSKDVDPGGWHHQISNGGELTGRYRAAFRWEALEGPSIGRWPRAFDLTLGGEGGVGYYTNVGANARVRLGLIASSALTQERHGSEPFLVREKLGLASTDGGGRDVEAYLFATGGWTLWGRNALLQGQFSESGVTLGFDEGPARMERQVWDWQIGATLRVRRFTATFTRTEHSRLFGPPNGRSHSWGTVLLTVRPKRLDDRPHGPLVR